MQKIQLYSVSVGWCHVVGGCHAGENACKKFEIPSTSEMKMRGVSAEDSGSDGYKNIRDVK